MTSIVIEMVIDLKMAQQLENIIIIKSCPDQELHNAIKYCSCMSYKVNISKVQTSQKIS